MKKIIGYLNRNYSLVWLMAGVAYQFLGESQIAFTMFTLFLIEDTFDRIQFGTKKS